MSAPLPPRVVIVKDGSRWIAREVVRSGDRSYAVEADGATMLAALAELAVAFAEATKLVADTLAGHHVPEVIA